MPLYIYIYLPANPLHVPFTCCTPHSKQPAERERNTAYEGGGKGDEEREGDVSREKQKRRGM